MRKILAWVLYLLLCAQPAWAGVYLDNTTSCPTCTNGATTYDPATRSIGGGSDTVYTSLASFISAITQDGTFYVRSGTYTRQTDDYFEGALAVDVSGSGSGNYTIVSAYPGEEQTAIICASSGTCGTYNSDPGDTGYTGSSHYYPNPAISIGGNWVKVIGFKTYGQAFVGGVHDWYLQGNDIGGGGPHLNQGAAVMLNTTGFNYNGHIVGNTIHHSCWGESNVNGSGIMMYNTYDLVIEQNTFYDTWSRDISTKDTGTGDVDGHTIEIRYNFFKPSTIYSDNGAGVGGSTQDQDTGVLVHHNIFYKKATGIHEWWLADTTHGITPNHHAYNNTFIDCDVDIDAWHTDAVYNFAQNLHYNSTSGIAWRLRDTSTYTLNSSDYNFFDGTYSWTEQGIYTGSSLAALQSASGLDGNSTQDDADFVDANGTTPEDFKRNSYVEGSTHAGAYETGNETIGANATDTTAPTVVSAFINGTSASIAFSEDLDNTAFANLINGDLVFTGSTTGAVDLQSCSENNGTVTCTAASTFVSNETVTLSSSGLTGDELCDASSNCIASLSGESVTNNTTAAQGSSALTGAYNASGGRPITYNANGTSIGLD